MLKLVLHLLQAPEMMKKQLLGQKLVADLWNDLKADTLRQLKDYQIRECFLWY